MSAALNDFFLTWPAISSCVFHALTLVALSFGFFEAGKAHTIKINADNTAQTAR